MSLGASSFVTFRRVILPALVPAIASGCSLAFAKAVGRVRLGRPDQRQHPAQDAGRLGCDLRPPGELGRCSGATALAVLLLAISLGVLLLIGVFERLARRHEG